MYLPGVYSTRLGQRHRELRAALHFTHARSHEWFNLHRNLASITSSATKLAVISVAPRPHTVIISQTQRLGVSASASHVYHTLPAYCFHKFWQKLIFTVTMSQPSISSFAPGVQLTVACDASAVWAATRDVYNGFTTKGFNDTGAITGTGRDKGSSEVLYFLNLSIRLTANCVPIITKMFWDW